MYYVAYFEMLKVCIKFRKAHSALIVFLWLIYLLSFIQL